MSTPIELSKAKIFLFNSQAIIRFQVTSFNNNNNDNNLKISILPSRQGMLNIPTASLQRGKTPPTSVLYMTLNN